MFSHSNATGTFKQRLEETMRTLPLHAQKLTETDCRINFARILGLCSRQCVPPADSE